MSDSTDVVAAIETEHATEPQREPISIEGLVNLSLVRDDLAALESELQELEQRQRAIMIMIAVRRTKVQALHDFLELVAKYRSEVRVTLVETISAETLVHEGTDRPAEDGAASGDHGEPASSGAGERRSERKLGRKPDDTQTRIAWELVKQFADRPEFELHEVVGKLRHFVPDGKIEGQWLGTYLAREGNFTNGIVDILGPSRYKMRLDAENILKNDVSAVTN